MGPRYELSRIQDTSTNEVEQAKAAIVKLEADLIQKLSVKKLAYDDPSTDKSILASVDGEVVGLEKKLASARDTQRRGGERAEKASEASKQLAILDAAAQQLTMGGDAVENSRKYLYIVLEYSVLDRSVQKLFKKSAMGYKDEKGVWKVIHQEDYPC